MSDSKWDKLVANTVFLSPAIVEKFCDIYGDAIVMPLTFRGNRSDYKASHDSGFPVPDEGQYYALWGMRPSRDACSIALGYERQYLERESLPKKIECTKGPDVERVWHVHHVYECGFSEFTVKKRAERFTNLANLVLMSKEFHEGEKQFIHGDGLGAKWLKWAIGQLYPTSSRILGPAPSKPVDSPDLDNLLIARENPNSLHALMTLRENKPAGSDIATRRISMAEKGVPDVAEPKRVTAKNTKVQTSPKLTERENMSPKDVAERLRKRGYLARQNKKNEPLFVNLGGPQSEVNKEGFEGMVLLNPEKKKAFGLGPHETKKLREHLMIPKSDGTWSIKENVKGRPGSKHQVTLFWDHSSGRICWHDKDNNPHNIDGYPYTIECHKKVGYNWADIENFLEKL